MYILLLLRSPSLLIFTCPRNTLPRALQRARLYNVRNWRANGCCFFVSYFARARRRDAIRFFPPVRLIAFPCSSLRSDWDTVRARDTVVFGPLLPHAFVLNHTSYVLHRFNIDGRAMTVYIRVYVGTPVYVITWRGRFARFKVLGTCPPPPPTISSIRIPYGRFTCPARRYTTSYVLCAGVVLWTWPTQSRELLERFRS